MAYILFTLLTLYFLPLVGIVASLWSSDLLQKNVQIVRITAALSASYLAAFRDIFGSLVIPLITAFSLPAGTLPRSVPRLTIAIFTFFLIVFSVAIVSLAVVLQFKLRFVAFSTSEIDAFEKFHDLTLAYAKEALAYIALTLGISASPRQSGPEKPGTEMDKLDATTGTKV